MLDRSAVVPATDVLSETLRFLGLTGGMRYDATLAAPWGFEVQEQKNRAPFYIVAQGECLIDVVGTGEDRRQGSRLSASDLAMLPTGSAHAVKDAADSPVVPFPSLTRGAVASDGRPKIRHGGDGPASNVLIGEFQFSSPLAAAALHGIDTVVHVRAGLQDSEDSLAPVLRLLCREQRSGLPGSSAATDELVKLLFLHVLRAEMTRRQKEPGSCQGNAMALMFDPALREVGDLLHRFPERPWTVAALADEAHMSRTSFAVRFVQVTGMSPVAYLTQVRMMNAIELLSTTTLTLEGIADRVGYGSEPAFSAAFKREMGIAPGAYRRRRRPSREDEL